MTPADPIHRFGRFEVRPAQRRLLAGGSPIAIGTRAFDVLLALIERRERAVGAQELLDAVWPGLVVEENNLRQQVATLRRLLGPDAIVTEAGRGYRFGLAIDADRQSAAPASLHNLPQNLPPLLGRDDELDTVLALARQAPLLTLAGVGGVGKTRLALAAAERLAPSFKDGVWWVELAPVADPALLTTVAAGVLDVVEEPGRPLIETLLDCLRGAQLLVVLDNCEHLVDAAARWAARVLQAAAAVRVLATSREPLSIPCEQVWRVQTLRTPDPQNCRSADELLRHPAPQLFVQRAMAADPAFSASDANAPAVACICHQLDGIPLALELAAARTKSMRVDQIADRLRDRFALLSRGNRTALERHQTLRSLIDWSHELLSPEEAMLLRRLSGFAGGWTLEACEAVCADEAMPSPAILELLSALVDKSLVMLDSTAPQPRYRMLETVRQFALEKLQGADEQAAVRDRHLMHLARFAEGMRNRLAGEDQLHWHGLAEAERDNLRIALQWAEQSAQPVWGLRILNALHRHWYKTMQWGEVVQSQQRLTQRHEQLGLAPDTHCARSFFMAGMLATNLDPGTGRTLCERAVAMSRALGFHEGQAWAQMWLAHLDQRRRHPTTAALFDESLRLGRQIEDPWVRAFFMGNALVCYANYEAAMGRDASALAMLRDCEQQIVEAGNDAVFIGHSRALQATMAFRRGHLEQAEALAAQSLALHRSVDSRFDAGAILAQQGLIALRRQDPHRALSLFKQSLQQHRHYAASQWVTKGLAHLLVAHAACGEWRLAAQLAGALGRPVGTPSVAPDELSSRVARAFEAAVRDSKAALGEVAFAEAAARGGCMTREQAIAIALGEGESADPRGAR